MEVSTSSVDWKSDFESANMNVKIFNDLLEPLTFSWITPENEVTEFVDIAAGESSEHPIIEGNVYTLSTTDLSDT